MRDAFSYSKSIRGKHRAAVSAGYDPCVSFIEIVGSVNDAVNGKITVEELIALTEARSEGNLARLIFLIAAVDYYRKIFYRNGLVGKRIYILTLSSKL